MSKRISKRTREQAARLCSVMASTDGALVHFGYWQVAEWLGFPRQPADVAIDAFMDAWSDHAEAEALLRTGWSP